MKNQEYKEKPIRTIRVGFFYYDIIREVDKTREVR